MADSCPSCGHIQDQDHDCGCSCCGNLDDMTLEQLGRVALAFALENETWSIFRAWCLDRPHTDRLAAVVSPAGSLARLRAAFRASSTGKLYEEETRGV